MEAQIAQFTNRGMNQDISVSKATNEFAFKNYNIRITAVNDNTLLSVTNEKLPDILQISLNKTLLLNNKIVREDNDLDFAVAFRASYSVKTTLQIAVTIAYENGDGTDLIGHHDRIATILKGDISSSSVLVGDGIITNIRIISTKIDDSYAYYIENYEDAPSYTEESYDTIIGEYRGHTILNDYLILFTHSENTSLDYIYKLKQSDIGLEGIIKYEGNLNLGSVVETLPYYESENVQKVYWVDGVNQPRYINIVSDNTLYGDASQFDFNPSINLFPSVEITKEYKTLGNFPSGVIQYFISYYNKFGAETGIIWSSDLQYITDYSRGVSPEESSSCSFKLDISNIDASFDYIRLYSLQRSSLNGTPICSIVKDIPINNADKITIEDFNTYNEIISPTSLLFLGGSNLIASTLTQKDNTLFLGDLKVSKTDLEEEVKEILGQAYDFYTYESNVVSFSTKIIGNKDSSNYQLNQSEETIKTFKCGETYRFALQFQSNDGSWTQPIWVGDKKSTIRPSIDSEGNILVSTAVVTLSNEAKSIISKYYSNYRLLIAEPSISDREVLAQGIVNPTVFNYAERVKETGPYAQASWILRPRGGKAAFNHLQGLGNKVEVINNELVFSNLETCEIQNSLNKPPAKLDLSDYKANYLISFDIKANIIISGWYVCNCSILKITGDDVSSIGEVQQEILKDDMMRGLNKACEIMISKVLETLNITETELEMPVSALEDFLSVSWGGADGSDLISSVWDANNFSIKKKNTWSVVSNGSNDANGRRGCVRVLEANDNLYPIESYENNYYVDSNILTFHSPEIEDNESLFDEADLYCKIIGILPVNQISSDIDLQLNTSGYTSNSKVGTYSNKNETLINTVLYKDASWSDNGTIVVSSVSHYVYLWNKTGSIIGQTADSKTLENDSFTSVYAELDKKIMGNHYTAEFPTYFTDSLYTPTTIKTTVFNSTELETKLLHTTQGVKYYQGNCNTLLNTTQYKGINIDINYYKTFWKSENTGDNYSEGLKQYDPVYIKYKTSPHIVLDYYKQTLPRLQTTELSWDEALKEDNELMRYYSYEFPWIDEYNAYQELASLEITSEKPYFYLVELCRPPIDSTKIYGGVTENAIENIKWIVASLSTPTYQTISKSFGDTYFQDWNHLHSYPYTREDENSVIDILTFKVETHINVEGRYDKTKLIDNILGVNENTYGKTNPVYSQMNNYFTYNILDSKFEESNYTNQIVFSLQKAPTAELDEWCNINLSSSFNLDGIKGKINKLINFNDTIIAFQDEAISAINYNNQTALSTESGVPIEIANSGKVNGYSIITGNVGCQNKQSICETSSGIYFINDLDKTLYRFNKEGLSNISSNGMSMWFKNNLTQKEKLFYDSLTNDIYITNEYNCITYNEALQSFVSFMPYEDIKSLFNFKGKSYLLDPTSDSFIIKEMFAGDYSKNYYIEYKINPEPLIDKTFTNIEYIADCFDSTADIEKDNKNFNFPFNRLDVWNEHQEGYTDITERHTYPNFERKFRIWRLDIPRDTRNLVYGRALNRIRNPWIYLKLSNNTSNKMVFHNLLIKYYK